MDGNYAKWLENEQNWIDGVVKQKKKQMWLSMPLLIAGCAVALGVIGILAGGGVQGMLQNALYGVIFGVICALLLPLLSRTSYPAKCYRKCLKEEIEDVLSPAERDAFAAQMSGADGNMKTISWTSGGKLEGTWTGSVRISEDYALFTSSAGTAVMVQLQKVKKVEVDVREYTVTTRSSGFKVQQTSTVYPMYFYYQIYAEGEKRKIDKEFTFNKREIREELSHYLYSRKIFEQ